MSTGCHATFLPAANEGNRLASRAAAVVHHGEVGHRTRAELLAGLDQVAGAPSDGGRLELIVRRPVPGERETLDSGELTLEDGLVGDGWLARGQPPVAGRIGGACSSDHVDEQPGRGVVRRRSVPLATRR